MATQSHPFTRIDTAPSAAATAFGPATLSLVRELFEQLATLVRQELALAGAELGRSLGSLTAGRRRRQPDAVAPQRSRASLRRDRDMVARHLS